MKLTDLLKEIKVGKVYTAKDKPPFKVNEYGYKTLIQQEQKNQDGGVKFTK